MTPVLPIDLPLIDLPAAASCDPPVSLTVMYRGLLTSCNYACSYCPFAKRRESAARQQADRESLARFTDWLAAERGVRWRVLFTPWGEALVRGWYRQAVRDLSHQPHVERVAVQTNLSCSLDWIDGCRTDRVALWATFHPTECRVEGFVERVRALRRRGVALSVGAVGVVEHLAVIEELRRRLPEEVPFWLNAQQPRRRPYTEDEVAAMTRLDPQFGLTLKRQRSLGLPCRTGEWVFTVDGAGEMRRCHFVDEVIGNLYAPGWREALRPRLCPKGFCDCYLGVSQRGGVPVAGGRWEG